MAQYKQNRKHLSKYTQKDLIDALEDIDKGVSCRMAAKKYGIPKSTLNDKANG